MSTVLSSTPSSAGPTQAEFVEHGLSSSPIPEGAQCSICIEDYVPGEEAVKLIICSNCYFHRSCLLVWFNSTHPRRGTCPNDRTLLLTSARPHQFTRPPPPTINPGGGSVPRLDIQAQNRRADIILLEQREAAAILNSPEYIAATLYVRIIITSLMI